MRHSPVRFLLGLAFCAGLLPARPPEDFPGLGGKWRYYRSPNFEMYSTNDDWSSRDALERLELLRAVVLEKFNLNVRLPLPVTIFYFDSARDFRGYVPAAYAKNESYVGFCFNQADRTVIVLSPSGGDEEARTVVYHEYIHYVFRITEGNPPPWFNEGVAELYSTIKDVRSGVEVGLPAVGRIEELRHSRMLPLEQLFGATYNSEIFKEDRHTGVFYAESWAFLHFCQFGESKFPPEKLHLFLAIAAAPKAQNQPARVRQACQALLGCDYPELMRQLEHYVVDGSYHWRRFARPKIDDPKTYSQRPAPRAEMADRLAELSLRTNRTPLAKLALLNAVDREPTVARLQEVLGNDAYTDGEMTGVREHWGRAVALGTDNPAIYHELALIESRRWFETFDLYFRLPEARAAELRDLLQRSIKSAPEQTGAYEMLAWVESAAPHVDIASVNLVQSHFARLTDKSHTLLALALIRLRLNDAKTARGMLDDLTKMDSDKRIAAAVAITRAEIDRREPPKEIEEVPSADPASGLVPPEPK